MDKVMNDRQAIVDATIGMVVLADRREWEALTQLFTEEVTADYTALTGGEVAPVAAVDLVDGWKQGFAAFTATQHMVTNHEVAISGEKAEARAYFQATHCKPDGTLWILGGKYHFELIKQTEAWRIAAVTMTPLWARDESNAYGQ